MVNVGSIELHHLAWIIGAFFTVISVSGSIWLIYKHLKHMSEPQIQRHIVRIILMIPIYTIDSYLSLIFKDQALYFNVARDCYEAYVLYVFFKLLCELAEGEEALAQKLEQVPQMRYSLPLCCFHIKPGRIFLHRCKQFILQFVVLKPPLAIATFILEILHKYEEGSFSPLNGYLYITIIYNISITLSLYFLVLFYEATKDILKSFKPISKFLCIKSVIFFSFWQGVVIAIMAHFNILIQETGDWTQGNVASGLQNFIICLEMVPLTFAFAKTFGYSSFRDPSAPKPQNALEMTGNLVANFTHVANVTDVMVDARKALKKEPLRDIAPLTNFMMLSQSEQLRYVVKQGWLSKQGEDLVKNWKKRYVVLLNKPKGMAYFKKNPFEGGETLKARGFIDFDKVTNIRPKKDTLFNVETAVRNWHFGCESTFERDAWVRVLETMTGHTNVSLDDLPV